MAVSCNETEIKTNVYLENIERLYSEAKYKNIKKLFNAELENDFNNLSIPNETKINLGELFAFFLKFEKERLRVHTELQNPGFIKKINLFIDKKTYEIEKLFNFNEKDFGFHLFYISIGILLGVLSFGASLALFQMPLIPALISGALNILFFIVPTYIRRFHFYQNPADSKYIFETLDRNYVDLKIEEADTSADIASKISP